ncbi:Aldo/keto reductase [Hortaea werneckii]|uniref:NADP-dependent oxidoreductase domain-containing protein n=2 Tax=Hortaea werneckii TaxID=91943 RepID=A0A3M7I3Q7_HORWE|nr:Aldo/keto reductase [Hortaea werneckii]OTA39477.1 hypothetical protein BTJ68_00621 [Hortaea werneckii EXF-2000]KAI6809710.1 Aldo/keto reductase [Hortaea werneckii]KAI6930687.1 Aldo/keto reductase [Hortaea werneckii]KAI6933229.1 Aldo/keto reductase [Hortaea werneckii]
MHPLTRLLPLAALALTHQPEAQLPLTPNSDLPGQPLTLDTIPLLGYGTWNLKGDNVSDAVSLAIQTGYRHIDAAAVYGNEKDVGTGIADGLAKTGLKREDLWITSKLWNDHHGPDNVESGLAKTLSDLNLSYLDLYHMHWPVSTTSGTPEIEYLSTWDAMVTQLLSRGLVRHLGISNFSPAQLTALLNHTSHPPSVHQMELHPYLPQTSFLALHRENGIHVTAYSPFAGTNPTYAPGRDDAETPLLENPLINKIAAKRNCTPAQVSLVWGMSRGTSVIPKAQHADYIRENFESVGGGCRLKAKDLRKIDKLSVERQHRYNNPSKSWGVPLYEGLEDAGGRGDYRLRK